MASNKCATDNCSSNVSMEKWIEGDAPREYCEDCYQKDQDESDNEDEEKNTCYKCDVEITQDNFYRDEFNNKNYNCCNDCGIEEEEKDEEVVRRECFKCDKIYYDVDYSCCCGKCCSYCRESDKKEEEEEEEEEDE